jgi:hypothetical protein
LTLTLEASRLVLAWWAALHVLLAVATLLVAWPIALELAALVAVAAHAVVGRPRGGPRSIEVAADGSCVVPEWGLSPTAPGPRTLVCTWWIRLDLRSGTGPPRRDILLFVDQLDGEQWARLRALLERARCDTAHVSRRPGEPI